MSGERVRLDPAEMAALIAAQQPWAPPGALVMAVEVIVALRIAELERDLAAARSALAAVREVRSSAAAARAVADRDAARIAGQVRTSGEGREG